MKTIFTSLKLLLLTLIFSQTVFAQSAGDYRSVNAPVSPGSGGNWSDISKWETYNGTTWVAAATAPTSADGVITIRNGDSIRVNVAVTADQIVVEAGSHLAVNVAGNNLTLNDGAGTDLVVNGTLLLRGFNTLASSSGTVTVVINGTMDWFSGVIQAPTTIAAGGTLNLALDFQKDLNANLTNNGTINWATGASTGGIFFNNVTLTNNGTINEQFQSNRGFFPASGTNSFVNTGTFNKTTTFSFTNNGVPVTNSGTLQGIGTITLNGLGNTNTGIIRPGTSPGILGLSANLLTGQTPTVRIEIIDGSGAGTGHDRLDFNAATVDVSGTTLIVEEDDTAPLVAYTIMNNAGGVFTGNFAAVTIPLGYSITYTPGVSTSIIVTKLVITLPAVWGDFNALAKNNNRVNLNWSTLQENNVSHYTVEYSANGRDYTSIGTVAAAGNTTNVTNYSFVHNTPDVQKTNYYRIRQSDLDGKTAYSVIRPVRFSKGTVAPILVTPNPVRDRLQLSVQAENIRIMLVDLSGRTLKNMNLQPGNHELSVTELAPGMYHLVIFQDGLRLETQKLIKQ
jgi:hypothetical protein